MAGKKILVCPEGSYVEDGVLTLPTTWDGDTFRLVDPYITIVSPQTQGGIYTNAYSIPSGGGTASFGTESTWRMFTGATVSSTKNTIYTSNDIII